VEKAVKVLAETVKAVEKTACAEEKKAETVQNLKTTQTLLEQLTETTKTEKVTTNDYVEQWLNEIEWDKAD